MAFKRLKSYWNYIQRYVSLFSPCTTALNVCRVRGHTVPKSYISNNVSNEEVYNAVNNFSTGQNYLSAHARAALSPAKDTEREPLTSREQTILLQLAQGKSNKNVAEQLEISVRTVETHRKNIKRKLGISSTAGLTRYALEHGVLQGTGGGL